VFYDTSYEAVHVFISLM